jgi:hypothetical protein
LQRTLFWGISINPKCAQTATAQPSASQSFRRNQMEPILVPGTPKEAFNKHRHVSDLVRKQVEHFKHIEEKLPDDVRASLPQHDVVTENEAARYISAMTTYLLSRPRPKQAAKKTPAIKPPAAVRPAQPLALAAAAAPTAKKSPAGKKSPTGKKAPAEKKLAAKKKSAPKKETSAAKKTLSTTASTRTKAKKSKKSSSKRKK